MALKALNVQIQPDRSPGLNSAAAVCQLRALASNSTVNEGNDDGRYINVAFRDSDLAVLWADIGRMLAGIPGLSDAAIVTCEGENGWDDYLLLHHFDASQARDAISN